MEWYKRGKAAVTNGSTKVVCSTASFVGNIERGEAFVGPDARHYEITKVVSATEITIAKPYAGETAVGDYDIIPVQGYSRELAHAAADIIEANRSIEKNTEAALTDVRESLALSIANIALVQDAADSIKTSIAESDAHANRSLASATQSEASAVSSSTSAAASSTSADTAKKWATQTTAEVAPGQGYGAKYYADKSASSAATAEAQKTAAVGSATAAKSSENAAKTSQTASETASAAAKASETAARASETAAAGSASGAETSKLAAAGSASNAAASATAAKTSETAAKASETAAKASQLAAKTSETTTAGMIAAANDTAAAINANVATANTAATNAKASEAAAANSAAAAKTSETAAKTSQTAAAGSASTAATKATEATTSATASEAHKNAAGVSAAAAKASETAAKASETAAGASQVAAKASESKSAASAASAKESERLVTEALAGVSSGVSDLGDIDMSSGQFPTAPVLTSIWTVSVEGTVAGDYYAVGDQLYYSAVTKRFTHIGNAGGVKTLSGKRGDLTVEDVLPEGANGQVLKHNGSKWIAGTDNNTTYSGMSQAEATAATATTQRLISPFVLKEAILYHSPPAPAVAPSAVKLATARTINGVPFDGTANVTISDGTKLPTTGGTMVGSLVIDASANANIHLKDETGTKQPQVRVQNSMHDGLLQISTAGNFGLYSLKHSKWLIVESSLGVVSMNGNASTATTASSADKFTNARKINGVSFDGSGDITIADSTKLPLTGGTITGDLSIAAAKQIVLADHVDSYLTKTVSNLTGVTTALVQAKVGSGDFFRIGVGATASNAGYAEIATADDGTEPIYVRQYTGAFATIKNELTLLDVNGNSGFPGSVYSNNGFFSNAALSYVTALQAGGSVLDGTSAAAGRFVPFIGSRTTNGGIGIAAYKDYIQAFFITKENIDAGTNSVSKSVILMNENGDGTWAGKVSASSFKGDGSEVTGLNAENVSAGTLPVARGGTGVTSATGDGSVVLSANPTLTGAPKAPTAADGTNTTQLATTAFVQSAIGGVLSKTATGGTVTLTDAEASNPVIVVGGTLTSNLTVIFPGTTKRVWVLSNQTSGAFTVSVKTATGTGVTVAQKKRNLIFTDGENIYDAFNDFDGIALTGVSTAPTASVTTNTTQIATTAFVQAVNSADTGSSATAVKLKTARTINGVSFDGTANITVEDSDKLPLGGGTVTGALAVSNTSAATTTDGQTGALRTLGGLGVKGVSVFGDRIGVGVAAATTVQLDVLQNTVAANSAPYGARFLTDIANGALTASRSSYGQYTRIRSYLTYANGKALGFNMTTVGGHFEAQDSIAGAHTQELYGLRGYAIVSQSTGGTASDQLTGRIEGVRGYALLSAADQTASAIVGSYHYAHLNNATAIATGMTGVEAYVRNQTGTVTGNSYIFRGSFSGTFAGARYGIYITGASVNQMDGYLALVGNTAATSTTTGTLRVTGGAGFTGQVHAAGFTGDLTGNATTATTLATARTINGVAFDGSKNITITASGTDSSKLPLTGGTMTGNLTVPSAYASNWFRSTGATGWYSETYGGGVMMQDTTWVRIYGSKAFHVSNEIAATGNITAYYSDARLKENLRKIEQPLAKLAKLTGYHYNANELGAKFGYDPSKQEVGLLAQDVEAVMPECVEQAPFDRTDKAGESLSGQHYKTLKYDRLAPLMIEGIKELAQENEELKKRIERLEEVLLRFVG